MDPFLLQAGIDTPAKFFEAYGFYDDLSTGLGGGFNFNNPLEPPPSPAHTGNQATRAHHGEFHSLMDGVEGYDPWFQGFTDGGFAFGAKYLRPAFEKSKEKITWGEEPQYSDLEEEVSVEETDSEEDRRPARSAWKRPVGSWSVSAGSVVGEGKQPSSDGVPHADTPEWQQDEDNEEFEGDDDEYERPARLSGAPAPTISSRKASAWSDTEDAACIKYMKEVCTLAQYAAIAGTEKRFEVVADRMKREAGFNRTASGVKLQWNRRLRAASKFEDRGEKKRASGLTTSALGQGTKRGTPAVTSLVSSKPSRGKKSSATSAQSTETSSLSGRLKGKRKVTYIDSDNEADDEDLFSSSRPYPAKRPRIAAEASSSALPSTQDVAYYDLSTANILSGPRASRYRPATTAQATNTAETPRTSSRQQPITTANDDADDEEEAPEPNYNSLSFWQEVLRKRQARVARQREEYERQQQQEEEEPEDDEPIVTTADRARKSRELRKQKTSSTNESASTTRASSATRALSSIRSSLATRPASTTRPTSATTSSSTTTTGPSCLSHVGVRCRPQASSTTRTSARRFDRLSAIAEDAEQQVHITPATAAQIAADEEIARQMQEQWNEEPAPRARRGRGFR
ncbi:hypothetical protein KCU98_g10398, partial [Aureobasidium melanogenum]